MKSLNKLFIFLVLVAFTAAHSQELTKSGTTAASFLKIGVGPRAIGMGGAFTATANDMSSMYWNPAGMAMNYNNEAFFNHVDWFADMKCDYAAIGSHLPGIGTVGAFVNVFSMDEMNVRTLEAPEGTGERFSAGGIAIGVNFARELTDNFSIGFNVKYISEHIWHMSATGFALDAGTMYKIPILNELRIAASITNFGTKMKMTGRDILIVHAVNGTGGNYINTEIQLDSYDLPLIFRAGVAADVIKYGESRFTAAIDAIHPNDHYEAINCGGEYSWNDIIMVRAGYKSLFQKESEEGVTFGVGIHYRVMSAALLKVDYAYEDFGRLTSVHYFSFGVKF